MRLPLWVLGAAIAVVGFAATEWSLDVATDGTKRHSSLAGIAAGVVVLLTAAGLSVVGASYRRPSRWPLTTALGGSIAACAAILIATFLLVVIPNVN